MGSERFDAALLSAVLENAVDGIITIDTEGRVRSFNKAAERIFGYDADEVIGQNVSMLMPEPDRGAHDGYIANYLDTGERKIIGIGREVRGLRKNGATFPMHLGVSEVEGAEGRHFAGIIRDETARHQLEEARTALIDKLESANAELERFTYTVSHDLKSPLITIKGFLGSIVKDAESGNMERLRKDVDRIGRAADKMTSLLDELLELSRIGRIANPSETFDMTEVAREVVGLLAGPIAKANAVVTVEGELGDVFGDRTRIAEVVQNLTENALKFSREADPHPVIEIGKRVDGEQRVFFVRDNGVGIDSNYLDRVFRLFEQLDQHRDGTGIGLALSKRIIEVHDGEIWAESEGPRRGTTICFTIRSSEEE